MNSRKVLALQARRRRPKQSAAAGRRDKHPPSHKKVAFLYNCRFSNKHWAELVIGLRWEEGDKSNNLVLDVHLVQRMLPDPGELPE